MLGKFCRSHHLYSPDRLWHNARGLQGPHERFLLRLQHLHGPVRLVVVCGDEQSRRV